MRHADGMRVPAGPLSCGPAIIASLLVALPAHDGRAGPPPSTMQTAKPFDPVWMKVKTKGWVRNRTCLGALKAAPGTVGVCKVQHALLVQGFKRSPQGCRLQAAPNAEGLQGGRQVQQRLEERDGIKPSGRCAMGLQAGRPIHLGLSRFRADLDRSTDMQVTQRMGCCSCTAGGWQGRNVTAGAM